MGVFTSTNKIIIISIQLKTLDEVNAFIDKANSLLGYPDGRGTETYCNVPDLTEIKDENGIVTDRFYELPVTSDLNEAMVKIATAQMIDETVVQ